MVKHESIMIQAEGDIHTQRDMVKKYNSQYASLINNLAKESEYGNASLEYVPLPGTCQTPQRLKNFTNMCWTECKQEGCSWDDDWEINLHLKGQLVCAPSVLLLGVRRSATTDMAGWSVYYTSSEFSVYV